jgi:hypothetical protein
MVVLTFPREADMTARIVRAAAAFGCGGWQSVLEFEAPQGIPDAVFARFSPERVVARAASPLPHPVLTWRDSAIICALASSRHLDVASTARRARMSEGTALTTLRALAKADAVERDGNLWRLATPYPSPLAEAVAVELKLADWKKALGQAARYQSFADRSFVVVAEAHAGAAAASAGAFQLQNVGLGALSPCGAVTFFSRPRRRRPGDPIARFLAGERLWAAHEHRAAPLAATA